MTKSVIDLQLFMSDMCWTKSDLIAQFHWAMCCTNLLAERQEAEDELMYDDYRYHDMMLMEMEYYNHARQMGWE